MAALADVLPPAAPAHILRGPPGDAVDSAVAALVNAGLTVTTAKPRMVYRVMGDRALIEAAARALDEQRAEGVSLICEHPSTDPPTVLPLVAPMSAMRRSTTIEGAGVATHIARALDCGLHVHPEGDHRFVVRGPSRAQVHWLAEHAFGCTFAEALERLGGLTEEALAAEEMPLQPSIRVNLPPRVSTTHVTYDEETGQIRTSKTVEETIQ